MFIPWWTPGMSHPRRRSLDCEVGWRISLETNSSGIVRGFAQWGLLWRDFCCQTKRATRIFQQKVQYGVRKMLIQSMIWYSCPFFPCFFSCVFQFPGLENTTVKRCWKTPLLEFGTSSDHTLNISLLEEPTKDSLHFELRLVNYFFHFSQIFVSNIRYLQNLQYINDKCWVGCFP